MTWQAPSVAIVPARLGKQDQGRDAGKATHAAGIRHRAWQVLAPLTLVAGLGGCGQKGPLVLPQPVPPPPSMAASAATPAPSATPRPVPSRTP